MSGTMPTRREPVGLRKTRKMRARPPAPGAAQERMNCHMAPFRGRGSRQAKTASTRKRSALTHMEV